MVFHIFLVAVEAVPQVDVLVLFRPGDQGIDFFSRKGPVGFILPDPHGREIVKAVHDVDPAHIGGEGFFFRGFLSVVGAFRSGGGPCRHHCRFRGLGRIQGSRNGLRFRDGRCHGLRRNFFRGRFQDGILLCPAVPVPDGLIPHPAVPVLPGSRLFRVFFCRDFWFPVLFGFPVSLDPFAVFGLFGLFGFPGFPGLFFFLLQQGFCLVLLPFRIWHFGHFQHHPQGVRPKRLFFVLADPSIFQQQVRHGIRAVFADFFHVLRIFPHDLLQVPAHLAQEGLEGIGGNILVDPVPFLIQLDGKGNDFLPHPGGPFVQFPQLDDVFPVFPAVPLHGLQQFLHWGGFKQHLQIMFLDLVRSTATEIDGQGSLLVFW